MWKVDFMLIPLHSTLFIVFLPYPGLPNSELAQDVFPGRSHATKYTHSSQVSLSVPREAAQLPQSKHYHSDSHFPLIAFEKASNF